MKPQILIATLLAFFLGKMAYAQTTVSGGIYTNTTWTLANSPYLMTNNIVVFPGVTLTIQPGVEVRVKENGSSGGQYYLETRGTINMVGTATAPITFRADTALITTGVWTGIVIKNSQGGNIAYNYVNMSNAISAFEYDGSLPNVIQLNGCNFNYNVYAVKVGRDLIAENCNFIGNEIAIYGWTNFTLNNCLFDKNQAALSIYASSLELNNCEIRNNNLGIRINSGSVNGTSVRNTVFENNTIAYDNANNGLIDSCLFIGNEEAVINTTYMTVSNSRFNGNTTALQIGFGTRVTECKIELNQIGIALGPISFGQPMPMVDNNRICYNQLYNIDNRTDLNMFIPTNCFCTGDSAIIEAKIFDGYDNISKGLISYAIFDTSCLNVLNIVNKTSEPTLLNENEKPEVIRVFPNPVSDYLILSNNRTFKSYSLQTLEGKEVLQDALIAGNNSLNLTQVSSGTYILVLHGTGHQNRMIKVVHF